MKSFIYSIPKMLLIYMNWVNIISYYVVDLIDHFMNHICESWYLYAVIAHQHQNMCREMLGNCYRFWGRTSSPPHTTCLFGCLLSSHGILGKERRAEQQNDLKLKDNWNCFGLLSSFWLQIGNGYYYIRLLLRLPLNSIRISIWWV